ncbi:MAG: hypothetical protein J7M19_06640, partial [Planctomycetes bacterium]|nr:hypothetical protein [Planctomycetota bacterium]
PRMAQLKKRAKSVGANMWQAYDRRGWYIMLVWGRVKRRKEVTLTYQGATTYATARLMASAILDVLEAQKKAKGDECERICRVCGCTEFEPCLTAEGPCHWVEPDLCSACAENREGRR